MSCCAASITQADVARALRAAQQAGGEWAVEIDVPAGRIRIVKDRAGDSVDIGAACSPVTIPY